jgi:2-oxoglutarate dehydrogenase complex dehydrogenase (E1) component-like enzyme
LRDCEKQKRGHKNCNQGKIYTKKSRIHLRELEDQLLQIPTKLLPQKKLKKCKSKQRRIKQGRLIIEQSMQTRATKFSLATVL